MGDDPATVLRQVADMTLPCWPPVDVRDHDYDDGLYSPYDIWKHLRSAHGTTTHASTSFDDLKREHRREHGEART